MLFLPGLFVVLFTPPPLLLHGATAWSIRMSKLILYVEDNFNNLLLMERIIEAEGHTMVSALDAAEGWAKTVNERPDLILMDLHLPGTVDGFALTQQIKQHSVLKCIPVIAITADNNIEAEIKARAVGCDAFLHKPADIQQIRAALRAALAVRETPLKQPVPLPLMAMSLDPVIYATATD